MMKNSRSLTLLCSVAALASSFLPATYGLEEKAPTATASDYKPLKPGEFRNFGIPAGISTHRGAIVVEGKEGAAKFLLNLNDWTGGYGSRSGGSGDREV